MEYNFLFSIFHIEYFAYYGMVVPLTYTYTDTYTKYLYIFYGIYTRSNTTH